MKESTKIEEVAPAAQVVTPKPSVSKALQRAALRELKNRKREQYAQEDAADAQVVKRLREEHDVAMTSNNAIFLFKNEYGFDTTQVNGRFRVARPAASSVFSRFFLPQRMGKNGYDRRHPMLTLRYLAAKAVAQSGRGPQTVSR